MLQHATARPSPEEAAQNIGAMLNGSAVALMLSIGHRLKILDAMADSTPVSVTTLAARTRLNGRYLREWLAAMVTGGIVVYDPDRETYCLPSGYAACLVDGAPMGNMAVYAQLIALGGAVQEPIQECFRSGGGLTYDDYPCFHSIMAEDSAQTVVGPLFDSILPLIPDIEQRLAEGIDVLDAGCGSGRALIAMAKRFPESRFRGYDLSGEAVEAGKRMVAEAGLANLQFVQKDLTDWSESAAFDLITSFDAIHDQKAPQAVLTSIFHALRPEGVHLMQDIGGSARLENNLDFPFAPFLYTVSCLHCTPVSLGQGGEGLGTMWGWETALAMLETAGFTHIEKTVLPHDPMNVWFVSSRI